jgi:hypothetical protein
MGMCMTYSYTLWKPTFSGRLLTAVKQYLYRIHSAVVFFLHYGNNCLNKSCIFFEILPFRVSDSYINGGSIAPTSNVSIAGMVNNLKVGGLVSNAISSFIKIREFKKLVGTDTEMIPILIK